MIEAGTGVKTPGMPAPPQDPAITEARNLILDQLLPELKPLLKLTPEQLDRVLKTADQFPQFAETFQQSTQQHWNGRGTQAINHVCSAIAKDIGVDKLTPFQQTSVGNTFIAWLQMAEDRLDRYGQSDNSLYDEFLSEYRSGFFDPIRRVGEAPGAGVARRNATLPNAPRGGGGVPPAQGGTPAQGRTEDEVHDAAFKAFVAASGR